MNRQEAFREVFSSAFDDSRRWRDWFFSKVAVHDDEISIALDGMGKPVGALLMQPYTFLYRDAELPTEYMSCVATKPEARSKGVASELIAKALVEAAARGSVLCELIPAHDHLYYFYRRFGYSGVFYVDRLRYTALHPFKAHGEAAEPDYELFSALERRVGCGILHSSEQYAFVLEDIAIDGGYALAVRSDEGSAIALAVPEGDAVKVKCLLADTPELADGVLAQLRELVGEKAIVTDTPPLTGDKAFLRAYGMVRILNAEALLAAVAASHSRLKYNVRVRDEIIEANNGLFALSGGKCRRVECGAELSSEPNLDVDIVTLAAILFSSERTASIFGLPARRPNMSLMLD